MPNALGNSQTRPGIISLGEPGMGTGEDACDETDDVEHAYGTVQSQFSFTSHSPVASFAQGEQDVLSQGRTTSMHSSPSEDIVFWVKQQVLKELALMNKKLDLMAANAQLESAWLKDRVSYVTDIQHTAAVPKAVQKATNLQKLDSSPTLRRLQPLDSSPTHANRLQANMQKLKTKMKVIGALVAAGKRARRSRMIESSRPNSTPSTPASQRFSMGTVGPSWKASSYMLWDSSAAVRKKKIQQTLNKERSHKTRRQKLWQFTECPYSSMAAYVYAGFYNALVVSSIIIAFLHVPFQGATWTAMQITFESFFAAEFAMRFICCPERCAFVLSFFNLVDFLSFLPLLLRLALSANVVLGPQDEHTLFVVVPMLRLLKLLRQFEKLQLLLHAFELALEALPSLLYTLTLLALAFSELFYFVEPRDNIKDLPTAVWFTLVTMTTVGYGEFTPVTAEGYVVASALIIICVMFMAIPIGIVGNAFSEVWGDRDRLLVMKRFRDAFLEGGLSLEAFQDIFDAFDADGSGYLDIGEFGEMLKTIQMNISEERVNMLYEALDKQGAGHITFEALVDGLVPKHVASGILQGMQGLASITPMNVMQSLSLGGNLRKNATMTCNELLEASEYPSRQDSDQYVLEIP